MNKIVLFGVLAAVFVSGCAIDRSELATPEAMRNLPPPPEVVATSFCEDVPADAGVSAAAVDELNFDAAADVIDAEANDYFACVVTNNGIIELTLFDDNAPTSVNNFVFLASEGFYNGTTFHRVVPDFVIQGGDRNAPARGEPVGTGGPGYMWSLELGATSLTHETGTLAMARAQSPDSNGGQFYITYAPQPNLNGQYNVFGEVSGEGDMDVVTTVAAGDLIRTIVIVEQPEDGEATFLNPQDAEPLDAGAAEAEAADEAAVDEAEADETAEAAETEAAEDEAEADETAEAAETDEANGDTDEAEDDATEEAAS